MKLAYGKAPHNERQPLVAVLVALLIIVGNIGCAWLPGTDNPQTTATPPASISASASTLGGSEAAFTAKFGEPAPRGIYTLGRKRQSV